jgi:transcriptional regulator with XRE-family HTH domain
MLQLVTESTPVSRPIPRLRTLRRAAHMTQKDLAARAGVAPHTAQRWESGKLPISDEHASMLGDLFGVSLSFLLGAEDIPQQATPNTPNRVRRLRQHEKLTLRQLADRVGVDESTLGRWERGQQAVPEAYRVALAEIFEVTVPYVMRWDEAPDASDGRPDRSKFKRQTGDDATREAAGLSRVAALAREVALTLRPDSEWRWALIGISRHMTGDAEGR